MKKKGKSENKGKSQDKESKLDSVFSGDKYDSEPRNTLESEKRQGINNRASTNSNQNGSDNAQVEDAENENEEIINNQHDADKGEQKADVPNATINMVKGFIGIGILTLPSGFAMSGWFGGLLFFSVCGSMILYLSQQMMEVANKTNSNARSITEFSVQTLGKEKETLVNIFLFGIQLGICVAYVIFFATYFQESLCFFVDYDLQNSLCGSRISSLLISLLLVTPSIFIRHMSKLKTWSMFANGLILISLGVVVVSCLMKMDLTYMTSDSISAIHGMDFGNAIGLFVFAFEGTTLYFEIRHSMKEPTEFKRVLNNALGGGIIIYGLIGLIGYLAFGSKVRDVILFNFPMTNPLYVFIQIFYCIAILLSYPLQMFPLVNIMEIKLLERMKTQNLYQQVENQANQSITRSQRSSRQNQSNRLQDQEQNDSNDEELSEDNPELELQNASDEEKKQFHLYSLIIRITSLLFVFFVAIVFKKLTVFLNLIGSVGGCFFCFILPVVVYEKAMPEASQKKIYFHRSLLVVGVLLSFVGTLSSLKSIYKSI